MKKLIGYINLHRRYNCMFGNGTDDYYFRLTTFANSGKPLGIFKIKTLKEIK